MNQAVATPIDVRLMNAAASLLFVLLALLVVGAAVWWALRNPLFALAGIEVEGDVVHSNAVTLRTNVAPRLTGNFFLIDLAQTRAAFEAVPWVRRAVVRREFPNRLGVTLQEHVPVALWGTAAEPKLINNYGEVFEANVADVEHMDLPRLAGPDGQAAHVLAMYQALEPLFEPLEVDIAVLELSGRGGWHVELGNDAVIELGRGSAEELTERAERFVRTVRQVASQYGRSVASLESADLRHGAGYAIRLRGVTTVAPDAKKK